MKEIILYKGKQEIIEKEYIAPKVNKFYDFICSLFSDKGYSYKTISTDTDKLISHFINKNTTYLVGHSIGTIRILKEFKPKIFPSIKGLILFDTRLDYINHIKIDMLIFLSKNWISQDYTNLQNVKIISLDDDHYFNNSFELISKKINEFIDLH